MGNRGQEICWVEDRTGGPDTMLDTAPGCPRDSMSDSYNPGLQKPWRKCAMTALKTVINSARGSSVNRTVLYETLDSPGQLSSQPCVRPRVWPACSATLTLTEGGSGLSFQHSSFSL
jgi:hypothetical protein